MPAQRFATIHQATRASVGRKPHPSRNGEERVIIFGFFLLKGNKNSHIMNNLTFLNFVRLPIFRSYSGHLCRLIDWDFVRFTYEFEHIPKNYVALGAYLLPPWWSKHCFQRWPPEIVTVYFSPVVGLQDTSPRRDCLWDITLGPFAMHDNSNSVTGWLKNPWTAVCPTLCLGNGRNGKCTGMISNMYIWNRHICEEEAQINGICSEICFINTCYCSTPNLVKTRNNSTVIDT